MSLRSFMTNKKEIIRNFLMSVNWSSKRMTTRFKRKNLPTCINYSLRTVKPDRAVIDLGKERYVKTPCLRIQSRDQHPYQPSEI